jgi:hypothetical protein
MGHVSVEPPVDEGGDAPAQHADFLVAHQKVTGAQLARARQFAGLSWRLPVMRTDAFGQLRADDPTST